MKNVFNDETKAKGKCFSFYEWKTKGDQKLPYYTKRKDGKLMLLAGLYDIHQINNADKYTCAICTTNASDFFSKIHKRMPAILDQQDIKPWLSKDVRWTDRLANTLKPYQGDLDW
jgi:putative SOS response-associated peptidase YedK